MSARSKRWSAAGAAQLSQLNLVVGLTVLALAAGVGYTQTVHCAHVLATVRRHVQLRQSALQQLDGAIEALPLIAGAGPSVLTAGLHRLDAATQRYEGVASESSDWPELRARIAATERALRQGAGPAAVAPLTRFFDRHTEREAAADAHLLAGVHRSHQVRNVIEMSLYAVALATTALLGRAARRRERATEHELRQRLDRLEEGTRELRAFAGRVAHDLRGPLTPILISSKLIETTTEKEPVRRLAERIEHSADRLRNMIDLLLGFARLERPSAPGLHADMADVATQVLDDVRERAQAAGAVIEARLEPGVVARCEPEIVASALYNLVDNALKYGLDGRDNRVEVRVKLRWPSVATLEVEDHGPGLEPDEMVRVFDPLFRGTRAGETSGIGLGLATVKRLVEAREGRVRVSRAPAGGALFIVELPAVDRRASP